MGDYSANVRQISTLNISFFVSGPVRRVCCPVPAVCLGVCRPARWGAMPCVGGLLSVLMF